MSNDYIIAPNGYKICRVLFQNGQICLEFKRGKKTCVISLEDLNSASCNKAGIIISNSKSQDVDFH